STWRPLQGTFLSRGTTRRTNSRDCAMRRCGWDLDMLKRGRWSAAHITRAVTRKGPSATAATITSLHRRFRSCHLFRSTSELRLIEFLPGRSAKLHDETKDGRSTNDRPSL